MSVLIRLAGPSDFGRVEEAYARFDYKRPIRADDAVWLAEDGDEVIAVVRIAHEEGVLVLRGMRVVDRMQRRGIGTLLLQAIAEWLGGRECFCIPYAHLVSFYAQIGFEQIEPEAAPAFLAQRMRDYRANGLDAILMRRLISEGPPAS
jgi:GNAT superfamily N-acetyltransferase